MLNNLPSGSDCECDLSFSGNIEISSGLSVSLGLDDTLLGALVLVVVLLSVSNEGLSLLKSLLSLLISLNFALRQELCVSGLFLHDVLWDDSGLLLNLCCDSTEYLDKSRYTWVAFLLINYLRL